MPSSIGDFTARIGLAPGKGVSYAKDEESGNFLIRFDGTNPTLIVAMMEAWLNDVSEAIKSYRAQWRDMMPVREPTTKTIEVDEEVYGFLKLKEKEDISPNTSLRYLLFGENPYTDPAKREDLARSEEERARVQAAEPHSLREAREDLEDHTYGQD